MRAIFLYYINMFFAFHMSLHFLTGLLAGYIVWKIWERPWESFMAGILGGFLIDLDHLIDYFLAFGWNFRLDYFLNGYQFFKYEKLYIAFHGWEYVFIALILVLILKNKIAKTILLALAFGMFFHLSVDSAIHEIRPKTYFVTHRLKNNFELEKLVSPEAYKRHMQLKKALGF